MSGPRLVSGVSPIVEKPFVEIDSVNSRSSIKLVDLFAGIGGFHFGIAAAASKRNRSVKPLLVAEIEPSCQEAYVLNHGCEVQGDINKVSLRGITQTADILTAGFPCQPFSNSGLKLGLSDPRGQFYFKIAEIIKKYDAKSFILENVSGIRTNGGGKYQSELSNTPQTIGKSMKVLEDELKKLKNYHIQWQEIDSSQLGSPQVRKRVYIVGVHKDFTKDFDLQLKPYAPNPFISVVDDQIIESLELSENQDTNIRSFMINPPSYHDGMRRVGQAYLCPGGNVGQAYHAYGMVPTLTKVWARFMPIYFPHSKENLPDIDIRDFAPNRSYGKGYIRRASVREVMRLQGFPDSFVPHKNDARAYEHAGNAVNAKIVKEIAEGIFSYIKK